MKNIYLSSKLYKKKLFLNLAKFLSSLQTHPGWKEKKFPCFSNTKSFLLDKDPFGFSVYVPFHRRPGQSVGDFGVFTIRDLQTKILKDFVLKMCFCFIITTLGKASSKKVLRNVQLGT